AGLVKGDLAAPVHADDVRGPARGGMFVGPATFAGRINRRVFHEQHGVVDAACYADGVDFALQTPCGTVIERALAVPMTTDSPHGAHRHTVNPAPAKLQHPCGYRPGQPAPSTA